LTLTEISNSLNELKNYGDTGGCFDLIPTSCHYYTT